MLLFSVPTNGTGMIVIGCINEAQTGVRYFNQDTDSWNGDALIGNRAAIDQATAAGRAVSILIWEDDQGSKCDYQTSSSARRNILRYLGLGGELISVIRGNCAVNNQCGGQGPSTPVFFAGLAVAALTDLINGADDDMIGVVSLPAGADPYSTPLQITDRVSSTAPRIARGSVTLTVRP